MVITLESYEIYMGAEVGLRRQMSSILRGLKDKCGFTGDGWGIHIEGALGELAFAKSRGLYWSGHVDVFKGEDVQGYHVRTRSRNDYELIVRKNDLPGKYVLVTGKCPTYTIHGWIDSTDAKRDEWKQTYGGRPEAWFVPQTALIKFTD